MTKTQHSKRQAWLRGKMNVGKLTKQEQLELGEAYLTSMVDPTRNKHR